MLVAKCPATLTHLNLTGRSKFAIDASRGHTLCFFLLMLHCDQQIHVEIIDTTEETLLLKKKSTYPIFIISISATCYFHCIPIQAQSSLHRFYFINSTTSKPSSFTCPSKSSQQSFKLRNWRICGKLHLASCVYLCFYIHMHLTLCQP